MEASSWWPRRGWIIARWPTGSVARAEISISSGKFYQKYYNKTLCRFILHSYILIFHRSTLLLHKQHSNQIIKKDPRSRDKRPHRNLILVALNVVELRLNRLSDLDTVFDRRHLQFSLQHVLPIHVRQPRMLLYWVCVSLEPKTLLGVLTQQLLDEVSEHFRSVLGETNHPGPHEVVKLSLRVSVKRRKTCIQFVKDNSKLVPICHSIMPLLVNYLQRKIRRSTAEWSIDIVKIFCLLTESEVSDKRVPILVKHNVLRLKISVKNVVLVQGLDP